MFSENLKTIRKAKGLSQEELAIRLNVVRQTVSKWEKGLSVPDADLLIRIADIFEVPVSKLLGAAIESESGEKDVNAIAEQLSRINEQLAIKNRRSRLVWKAIAIIFVSFVAFHILAILISTPLGFGNFRITTLESDDIRLLSPVPNITIDGVLYTTDGEIITLEFEEQDIIGHIGVYMLEWFIENDHANYNLIGAPFARYGNGIVVRWENRGNHEWWLVFSK